MLIYAVLNKPQCFAYQVQCIDTHLKAMDLDFCHIRVNLAPKLDI